jgi:diacylglycerol O-acyltransferase / wax synthase
VRSVLPRLSPDDLLNLAVEAPDTPMHVGAVVVLDGHSLLRADGRLRLAWIRAEIERRVAGVPELRRVLYRPGPLAGRPLWTDDPAFRVERHVTGVELPPPGDEEALLRLAEELLLPMLDRARPLWRMWFVTGLPDGRVALVVALHHAVADGLAAVRLVSTLLAEPAHDPVPPVPPPGWPELLRDNVRQRLAALARLVRPRDPRPFAKQLWAGWRGFRHIRNAPRTSLNASVGPRRRLAVLRLDLAEVKMVAHRYGGKANDVLLDLAAGGARALLRSRGEPVDGRYLHATVAASLRPPGRPAVDAGNRTGVYAVRLPIGAPDPTARLGLVRAETARAKHSQLATAGNAFMVWLARSGLARYVARRQHMVNLFESNLAGPPERIEMLGAPVLDLVPVGVLAGNVALSFVALSYAGRLTVTVCADADRYPDLPVLLAAMERDWHRLLAA